MARVVRRLRLRPRMIAAFSMVCALLVAITAVGISGASRQEQLSEEAADLQQLSRQSLELKFDATELFSHVLSYLVNVPYAAQPADAVADDGSRHRIGELKPIALRQLASMKKFAMTSDERDMFGEVDSGLRAMFDAEAAGASTLKNNKVDDAYPIFNEQFYAAYNQTITYVDMLVKSVTKRGGTAVATSKRSGTQTEVMMIIGCILALILAILLALVITRSITGPVSRVAHAMRRLARSDLTAAADSEGNDEMAEMSLALNQAVQAVRQSMSQVAQRAKTLTHSATGLMALSEQLGENVENAFDRVNAVSSATEEVSYNVATMKSAAEQVSRSSGEIARNGEAAVGVADRGVTVVGVAAATVGRVHDASIEIGKIVETITNIAQQTNLLALNATIEAARAGSAGKGFAIVAGEVKELAQDTAQATDDITTRIAAIQQATGEAIEAMGEVSQVVRDISGVQSAAASAVQQQSKMADEIRRGISEIADNSLRITGNISGLTSTTGSSKDGAGSARRAAQELATMAVELEAVVSTFHY